jgi:hypothetical protein
MLKFIVTLCCYCWITHIHAQHISIAGKVIDTAKNAVPNTTITLLHLNDPSVVGRTQTDAAGHYQFQNVSAGIYRIQASAAGMYDAFSPGFNVTTGPKTFFVEPIMVHASVKTLTEIKVTAQLKPVEFKQGKIIYNIEKSITASGSSAFEIVSKTPGVNVNQDGNILFKGNPNVNVMIDGKMIYLTAQQLTNLLSGMPAENLTRIEVSSNPSSEFDAAGNAGIINIITKKLNRDGYALDVSAGIGGGRYGQTTEGVSGNIKTRRFNFFGSYMYDYKKSYSNRTSYRVIENNGQATAYDRHSFEPAKTVNNLYKAGIDLYLDKSNRLSLIYNGYSNTWRRDAGGPTYLRELPGKIDSIVQNRNITSEPQRNNAFNVSYNLKLDTIGNTFSIDADYAIYKNKSDGFLGNQLFTPGGDPLQPYQQLNFKQPSDITIRAIKTDLRYALDKISIKAGLKYAWVRSDNNSVYDSLINNAFVHSTALSNHFIYDEKVFAGYISASRAFNKTTLDAGVRIESTSSKGNSLTANIVTNRNYTNVFPYVGIENIINDGNKIALSITRRIDRPVYNNLNPFRFFFDKYSYYEGNPFLQPEFAWNTTLSYTFKEKYIAQLTYIYTNNPIADFATQDTTAGTLKLTTYNFSHKYNYELLFIIPVAIGSFWTMQNTLNMFYTSYRYDQTNFSVNRPAAEIITTQTFKLLYGIGAEMTARYKTPTISGSYIIRRWFTTDAGFKKTFRKLDIKLACTDIFKTIHYWGYSAYNLTNISYNHVSDTRRVNINFLYHFGGKISEVKREKTEEENRL